MCGTSMACPQVAGGIALFVEQYRNVYGLDPSPALIKASFTAVASDLAGNDDADGDILGHPFDSKQGWGRMNLPSVLINDEGSVRYFDAPVVLEQTGDSWSTTVSPLDPSEPMRIMLVWTDALGHGLGGSTPAWNNDLDLIVTSGFGTYLGNNFSSEGWSTTGGVADGKNNTEGVFLGPTPPNQVTITIAASNLNSDGIPNSGDAIDQDFSVVCYNCASEPDYSITVTPPSQSVCSPATIEYTVLVGQLMGYEESVTLSAQAEAGIVAMLSEYTVVPPAEVTLTAEVGDFVQDGIHEIQVIGLSTDGITHDAIVFANVSSDIPSAPVLTSPPDGSTEIAVNPSFYWEEDVVATEWRFQLSTSASPSGVFHAVSNLETTVYELPMMLDPNTPYFWRVAGLSHCGGGPWTDWWTFRTTDAMTVLLVDDDDNSPDVRSYYTDMLDAAGLLYEIFDTDNSDNEPDISTLQGYPLVIWFSGDEYGGFAGPGSAGESALAEYIDYRGYLVLSSQDYLYDNGLTPFGQNYLGIGSYDSDEYQTSVIGASIFENMGSVPLSYPFSNWSDIVSPSNSAELTFSGNEGDAGTLLNGQNGGGTVFLGFPIEAMSPDDQQVFIGDVLAWVDDGNSEPCLADCNGDGTVDVADLLAIIEGWGTNSGCDVNGDGNINVIDLLTAVGAWGECP